MTVNPTLHMFKSERKGAETKGSDRSMQGGWTHSVNKVSQKQVIWGFPISEYCACKEEERLVREENGGRFKTKTATLSFWTREEPRGACGAGNEVYLWDHAALPHGATADRPQTKHQMGNLTC